MSTTPSAPTRPLAGGRPLGRRGLLALCWLLAAAAPAQAHKAHQHGVVNLDVALQGSTLSLQMTMPMDSLVGFEHRPRTPAQQQAAAAALQLLQQPDRLFTLAEAAQCRLGASQVEGAALQPADPAAARTPEPEHADVEAEYRFECAQPARLGQFELQLFERFARIQRIDVQTAGPQGQSRQTLRRPARQVRLQR